MIYRFWETPTGAMLIEITKDYNETGNSAYITDMNDMYLTEHGKHLLLKHVHDWGTVDFKDWDIRTLFSRGSIETEELTLNPNDKSVLKRTLEKEGFDYAILHYSAYDGEVGFNKVESKEFHALRNSLLKARQDLETWLALQGISE